MKTIIKYIFGNNLSSLLASILTGLLIFFVVWNWSSISIFKIGETYVQIERSKKEVFEAQSTVQKISNEIKQQKKELEKLSGSLTLRTLKQNLINDINNAVASRGLVVGGTTTGKRVNELVSHYKARYTKDILVEYLKGQNSYNDTIANDIDKLEEFLINNNEKEIAPNG